MAQIDKAGDFFRLRRLESEKNESTWENWVLGCRPIEENLPPPDLRL